MRAKTATALARVSPFAQLYTSQRRSFVHLGLAATPPARRRGALALTSKKSRHALRRITASHRLHTPAVTGEDPHNVESLPLDKLKRLHGPLRRAKTLITTTPTSFFTSTTTNPYHNLALENYLLTESSHDTNILFLYTNSPCVVIGRNQNPWVECDLRAVRDGLPRHPTDTSTKKHTYLEDSIEVDLLRRRSGGGTVVHSPGNLNYCAIVPNDKSFNRRTHAEMVVKALRALQSDPAFILQFPNFGGQEIKVNERHDIVMRPMGRHDWLKVSGSAFKLKRGRALHHGTLLFASPYLSQISGLLSSPGKDLITTKGVDSVRSPVGNLYSGDCTESQRQELNQLIQHAIIAEFSSMYGLDSTAPTSELGDRECEDPRSPAHQDAVELSEDGWKFGQTPRFTFRSSPESVSASHRLSFEANRGLVEKATIEIGTKRVDVASRDLSQPPNKHEHTLPHPRLQPLHAVEHGRWFDLFNDLDSDGDPARASNMVRQLCTTDDEIAATLARCFPPWHRHHH